MNHMSVLNIEKNLTRGMFLNSYSEITVICQSDFVNFTTSRFFQSIKSFFKGRKSIFLLGFQFCGADEMIQSFVES